MKNFALIGAAGYIAPRHLQAIHDTGNQLICAYDPSDSVGILDRYFEQVDFFTEFERFDRHVEKLRQKEDSKKHVHWVSICSPNYLHDSHIRFALRIGADAICEKPVVLNPWNIDTLCELEAETKQKIRVVLQLRLHDTIRALKEKIAAEKNSQKHQIELTYITSRGPWYDYSWKGDIKKSGGISTNIGIHFYDMLLWIFGSIQHSEAHMVQPRKSAGFMELEKARVKWFLSIDSKDLPESCLKSGKRTHRSITVDGEELEFSEGFTELHTLTYQDILNGGGFGLKDAAPSVQLVHDLRFAEIKISDSDFRHPFLKKL